MSYREENDQVILTMSRDEFDRRFSVALDYAVKAASVSFLSYEEVLDLAKRSLRGELD